MESPGVATIEIKDNKSTVRKLPKAERRVMLIIDNISTNEVTEDASDPKLIEVSSTNELIKKLGTINNKGKSVLKNEVKYSDGSKEIIEIGGMEDITLAKLSNQSSSIQNLLQSIKMLDDLEKINNARLKELLNDPDKINEFINVLKSFKEALNTE